MMEVKDIRKQFSGFSAVDGISFAIEKGQCFGLLGPNGAGFVQILPNFLILGGLSFVFLLAGSLLFRWD